MNTKGILTLLILFVAGISGVLTQGIQTASAQTTGSAAGTVSINATLSSGPSSATSTESTSEGTSDESAESASTEEKKTLKASRPLSRKTVLPANPELMQKLHNADDLLNAGNLVDAEKLYLDIIAESEKTEENKNFSEAYNNVGVLYFRKGDLPKAQKYFQQAIAKSDARFKVNPTLEQNYRALGNLALLEFYLATRTFDKAQAAKHLEACRNNALACMDINNTYARAYQALGLYFWKTGWKEDRTRNPKFVYRSFTGVDKPQDAEVIIEKFKTGMKYAENDRMESDFMVNIGFVYIELGKKVEAEKIALQAMEKDPTNPYAYALLGYYYQFYRVSNQFFNAIDLYKKALEFTPTSDQLLRQRLYYNTACIYAIINFEKKVYEYLTKAAEEGYRDFDYMRKDKDFYNVNFLAEFKNAIDELEKKYK